VGRSTEGINNMTSVSQENWFAVHVWAGREQLTSQSLRARGYDVFLPTYCERRRWSDRVRTVELALFAGYTFCRMQELVTRGVITTPGVIGIVSDGVNPIPVPTEEVDSIRLIVSGAKNLEPVAMVRVGQRVRVETGPLQGVEGIVQRADNSCRIVVSVRLLQRAVAVEIDPSWVTTTDTTLHELMRQRA
jgi:transcription antitermination factor NusG